MAKTVTEGFKALDNALKLDPQVDALAKATRSIIDEILLASGWMALSLLQGSYGRKTMYPPLKDVDLVVILPERLAYLRPDPMGPAVPLPPFKTRSQPPGGCQESSSIWSPRRRTLFS